MKKVIFMVCFVVTAAKAEAKVNGCRYVVNGKAIEVPFKVNEVFEEAKVSDEIYVSYYKRYGWAAIYHYLDLSYKNGEVVITDAKVKYMSPEDIEPVVLRVIGRFNGNYLECNYSN